MQGGKAPCSPQISISRRQWLVVNAVAVGWRRRQCARECGCFSGPEGKQAECGKIWSDGSLAPGTGTGTNGREWAIARRQRRRYHFLAELQRCSSGKGRGRSSECGQGFGSDHLKGRMYGRMVRRGRGQLQEFEGGRREVSAGGGVVGGVKVCSAEQLHSVGNAS